MRRPMIIFWMSEVPSPMIGGAFPDEEHGDVAVEAFDLVLPGVAVAAVDAEGVLDDIPAVFGREVFGHPGFQVVALAGVLLAGGHDHHLVCGLDLGRHLREPELYRLVLGDLLAEAGAQLRVADGELERAQRDAAARAATLTRPTSIPSIIW
jgi:hypothetical protein